MTTITGSAMVRPVHSAPAPNRASSLAGACFEAATARGPLRLYIGAAARHAVEAAVRLGRAEALLQALDAWIGATLDWQWVTAPAAVTATASHARALWMPDGDGNRAEPAARLELPWAALRTLRAPDETLARQLRWSEVPVVLTLARLQVGADELMLLEPGGAVLLPDSMQAEWTGTLRALDEPARAGAGVPVRLGSPWAPRRVAAGATAEAGAPAAGDRVRCEVRLPVPHTVPADRLAGWYEGSFGETGRRAGLWRCATEHAPAACLAAGELMPWGDGWALALHELYEIRQTGR